MSFSNNLHTKLYFEKECDLFEGLMYSFSLFLLFFSTCSSLHFLNRSLKKTAEGFITILICNITYMRAGGLLKLLLSSPHINMPSFYIFHFFLFTIVFILFFPFPLTPTVQDRWPFHWRFLVEGFW